MNFSKKVHLRLSNLKQETPLKKVFFRTIKAAYSGSKPLLSSTRAITNPVFYISDLQFKPWALAVLASLRQNAAKEMRQS